MAATSSKITSPATPRRAASHPPPMHGSVASSSARASSLQKGPALQKAMPVPKAGQRTLDRIGIDWHNTLEVQGSVSEPNMARLQELCDAGYRISILSYIGTGGRYSDQRRTDFYNDALNLPMVGSFERVIHCDKKVGPGGKVSLFKRWGVKVIFDDNKEICQEAMDNGIQVWPIKTPHETHQWFADLGYRPSKTFAQAVAEYLRSQRQ